MTDLEIVTEYVKKHAVKTETEEGDKMLQLFHKGGDVGFTGASASIREERLIDFCLKEDQILLEILSKQQKI